MSRSENLPTPNRKTTATRLLKAAAPLGVSALALIGCGKNNQNITVSTGNQSQETTLPVQATSQSPAPERPVSSEQAKAIDKIFEKKFRELDKVVTDYANIPPERFQWGTSKTTGKLTAHPEDLPLLTENLQVNIPNTKLVTLAVAEDEVGDTEYKAVSLVTQNDTDVNFYTLTFNRTRLTNETSVVLAEQTCSTESACSETEYPITKTILNNSPQVEAAFDKINQPLSELFAQVSAEELTAIASQYRADNP